MLLPHTTMSVNRDLGMAAFIQFTKTKFLEMPRICLRTFVCIRQQTNPKHKHTKMYLASSNLSPNGMQRFTKCMEKFLQFSVSLVVVLMPDLKQDVEFCMIFSIVKCTGNN